MQNDTDFDILTNDFKITDVSRNKAQSVILLPVTLVSAVYLISFFDVLCSIYKSYFTMQFMNKNVKMCFEYQSWMSLLTAASLATDRAKNVFAVVKHYCLIPTLSWFCTFKINHFQFLWEYVLKVVQHTTLQAPHMFIVDYCVSSNQLDSISALQFPLMQ